MNSRFSLKLVGGHGFGWSFWPHQLFHITTSIGIKNMGVTMLKGDVASSAGPSAFQCYMQKSGRLFGVKLGYGSLFFFSLLDHSCKNTII